MKTKKVIPGWNDYVEYHRKEAIFWHYIWKCNNSPRVGTIADIRNSTRAKYHYALRYVRKNVEIINNRSRDFWSEVKKSRHAAGSFANVVDGETDPGEIGNILADKFDSLYNSVPYNEIEMNQLRSEIDGLILTSDNCANVVTIDQISEAILRLKKVCIIGISVIWIYK